MVATGSAGTVPFFIVCWFACGANTSRSTWEACDGDGHFDGQNGYGTHSARISGVDYLLDPPVMVRSDRASVAAASLAMTLAMGLGAIFERSLCLNITSKNQCSPSSP